MTRADLVLEEVDVALAEAAELASRGPYFRILHSFYQRGTQCSPGEAVCTVWFIHRGQRFPLRLTTATLLLFEYLASHRHIGQTASHIEAGIRHEPFYVKHGQFGGASRRLTRRISHAAVKEYVKRVRKEMAVVFEAAGLYLNPRSVLVSEPTIGNQVLYRLKASVEWEHNP